MSTTSTTQAKLSVTTPNPTEIHMTREFAAPRHLLIEAMSKPELVKRWMGGKRTEVASAEIDYRVGGSYRYVFRLPDGNEFSFSGVYSEISDERVVHTELFNDAPEGAEVITTLTERDARTTLHVIMRFPSQEIRDGVVATGMADGAGESYDVLEDLVRR